MADGVTSDPGSGGATFGTDEDTGNSWHVPLSKIQWGADGTFNHVTTTDPFPVQLSPTDNAVLDTIDAAIDAINAKLVTGTVIGAVEISDTSFAVADGNALGEGVLIQGDDGTDRKNINVDATTGDVQVDVTNTVTVDLGANNDVTLATLPDTAAGDLAAINAALGGTLTVGSHAVTNAGTFAVQAAQSGTWNVTNVSGTVSLPTGAATAAKQPALGTAGTAASDVISVQGIASMTALVVDGSGVTQPVSGTVTANLSATDNAVLDSIQTAVEIIDNAINGNEMQVDIVAALPAGTNAIGKLAANSGVDIGDVDVLSIAAGSNLIGDVGISGARTSGGTTPYKNLDVDETEDEIKGTAGQVYWIHAINTTAAPLYLKFYNATAASVTVGTTTPVLTLPVPANADSDGAGFTLSIPNGIAFGTAITIAATTAVADAHTGAPGANALIVNLGYA